MQHSNSRGCGSMPPPCPKPCNDPARTWRAMLMGPVARQASAAVRWAALLANTRPSPSSRCWVTWLQDEGTGTRRGEATALLYKLPCPEPEVSSFSTPIFDHTHRGQPTCSPARMAASSSSALRLASVSCRSFPVCCSCAPASCLSWAVTATSRAVVSSRLL